MTELFIAAIPWDTHRMVLVHKRTCAGRTYIKLHTWNKHRQRPFWYPSSRMYVIPDGNAQRLVAAILAAARGDPLDAKPEWLRKFEARDPALVKRGSIRRRRRDALVRERAVRKRDTQLRKTLKRMGCGDS